MPRPPKELTPSNGAMDLFGSEVRRYRELAGLSIAVLAERINYSPSFVGAVERAESGCDRAIAEACDRELDTREALVHLWDGLFSRRPGTPVPEWFVEWPAIESKAEVLCVYDPCVVHGLLQTEDYARTLLFGDEDLLEGRLARQVAVTAQDGANVVYLLPEAVLWHDVGGLEVMRGQCDRLQAVVSPRLSIQVIPDGELHPGNEGGFMIATLPMGVEMGYVETAARGMILDAHKDVARLKERFSAIRSHALPVGMSVDLIGRTKEERWKS
jgi:hypothetical protein